MIEHQSTVPRFIMVLCCLITPAQKRTLEKTVSVLAGRKDAFAHWIATRANLSDNDRQFADHITALIQQRSDRHYEYTYLAVFYFTCCETERGKEIIKEYIHKRECGLRDDHIPKTINNSTHLFF